MPVSPPDMPALLAELARFLGHPQPDQTGAPSLDLATQLQAAQAWLCQQEADDAGALADFIGALGVRLAQDGLKGRITAQAAQFELLTLRAARAAEETERLSGKAQALNLLFAQALADLPQDRQAVLFSSRDYLEQNPDVAAAGVDPLAHYLTGGAAEGRAPQRMDEAGEGLMTLVETCPPPRFCRDMPATVRAEALALLGQQRPEVSVILPTWNRAQSVATAVASALLQSYAPKEVIVIDDGSQDATVALLQQRFPEPVAAGRLVIVTQENAGVSAARNAGLAQAQGDVVAYLDSDNHWDADHLLYAVGGLLAVPEAQSAYTAICRHNLSQGWSDVLFQRFDRAQLAEENFIDLNSFVHRRALAQTLGGFDTALTRLVDWDLILRYAAGSAPVALPVITGHHVVDSLGLDNITTREALGPNLARIRAKHGSIPEVT
ncbi:glycosyltransferase family A protein [Roseovarius sp.]|uniref:glycosyltransferase family 2 protein n=1 Tax=Roseovarius sp. TaxID=1486281 RepID=UPI00263024FE|nr:glycosyltransferase family A protein [Roseovarius sp.]